MAEHIVVTGGAGFIGSHLVDALLSRGDRVTVIDNFDPFYDVAEKRSNLSSASRSDRFRLVEADCADPEAVRRAFTAERVDAVVHLAARAGVRPSIADPASYVRTNLLGTQSLLDVARAFEIKRFVFASSSSVYGNNPKVPFSESDPVDHPISPYAATKRGGELLCHSFHSLERANVIALRFFTVYGPRQRPDLAIRKFAELMMAGRPINLYGDGSSQRDYTWITDIIQGVIAAIDRTGRTEPEFRIINLGESATTSLGRLVDLLSRALGVAPLIVRSPPQPGDVDRTYADVSLARRLLSYTPTTPIEAGIPLFAAWLGERALRR